MRVGAVVEALEVLAVVSVIARMAHAPGDGKLDRAPAVEGAVVLTVLWLRHGSREFDDADLESVSADLASTVIFPYLRQPQ